MALSPTSLKQLFLITLIIYTNTIFRNQVLAKSVNNSSNTTKINDTSSVTESHIATEPFRTLLDSITITTNKTRDAGNGGGLDLESQLGGGGTSGLPNLGFAQLEKFLDNVISVDEVGTWPGFIYAVFLMTIFWTVHIVGVGVIWIIWWYFLYGEEQIETGTGSLFKKGKKKKPSGNGYGGGNGYYGNPDNTESSFLPSFLKTYTNSEGKRRKRRNIGRTGNNEAEAIWLRIIKSIEQNPEMVHNLTSELGNGIGTGLLNVARQYVEEPAKTGDWWTFLFTWSTIKPAIVIIVGLFFIKLIIIWIVWSWYFYGTNGGLYSNVYGGYGKPSNRIGGISGRVFEPGRNMSTMDQYLRTTLKVLDSIDSFLDYIGNWK